MGRAGQATAQTHHRRWRRLRTQQRESDHRAAWLLSSYVPSLPCVKRLGVVGWQCCGRRRGALGRRRRRVGVRGLGWLLLGVIALSNHRSASQLSHRWGSPRSPARSDAGEGCDSDAWNVCLQRSASSSHSSTRESAAPPVADSAGHHQRAHIAGCGRKAVTQVDVPEHAR